MNGTEDLNDYRAQAVWGCIGTIFLLVAIAVTIVFVGVAFHVIDVPFLTNMGTQPDGFGLSEEASDLGLALILLCAAGALVSIKMVNDATDDWTYIRRISKSDD